MCGGTGEVSSPVWDEDSQRYVLTGTRPCLCTLDEDENEEVDDSEEFDPEREQDLIDYHQHQAEERELSYDH